MVAAARTTGVIGDDTTSVVFHDLDLLEERLAQLAGLFPEGTLHTVAIKANPLVEVLRVVVRAGHGLEAASFEEVSLALAADCPPERIVFDSPAKTHDELRRSLELGVRINADSVAELDRIEALWPAGSTSIIGLRINPLVGAGSIDATSVAARNSKFGVPIDAVGPQLRRRFERHAWLRCLHVHVGSQGCTVGQLVAAARAVADLRAEIVAGYGAVIDHVDIGGGLPVDYDEAPTAPPLEDYVAQLQTEVPELLGDVVLVTEFGRALQAGCGWAVTRVEYVKADGDTPTAVVHLGADFLLRPVYQPDAWRHRFSVLGNGPDGPAGRWRVAGPLCFGGDIIGGAVQLPHPSVGDLVVIHDVGAYTIGMWSRHCSRGMPAVVGYRRSGDGVDFELLRGSETPDDIVRFWSR